MGVFSKRVLLADLSRQATAEVDAVIDTGSSLCLVPESVASLLGLEVVGTSDFILADGHLTSFPIAGMRLEIEGRVAFITTAIGPDDVQPLLGAQALEVIGFAVEPGTEKLIPEAIRLLTMTGWPTI